MKIVYSALTLISVGLLLMAPATAQDVTFETMSLPDVCGVSKAHDMAGMEMATDAPGDQVADPAHQALLESMTGMHDAMSKAMTAEDIDVAFICGMIPHHMGAIAMAKAELQYGDNEWAKNVATNIIVAQEQEIAEMMDWLHAQ